MPVLEYVSIAAYGWSPEDWSQRFYPDDLPADWVPAYYANEFRQVLLSEATLLACYPALSDWQQEVDSAFGFHLEITARLQASPAWPVVSRFIRARRASCVITEPELLASLREHAGRVDLWTTGELLMECLHQAEGEDMQCGLLRSSRVPEPLLLRQWLDTLRSRVTAPVLTLFVDAPYGLVSRLDLMKQIYGWH